LFDAEPRNLRFDFGARRAVPHHQKTHPRMLLQHARYGAYEADRVLERIQAGDESDYGRTAGTPVLEIGFERPRIPEPLQIQHVGLFDVDQGTAEAVAGEKPGLLCGGGNDGISLAEGNAVEPARRAADTAAQDREQQRQASNRSGRRADDCVERPEGVNHVHVPGVLEAAHCAAQKQRPKLESQQRIAPDVFRHTVSVTQALPTFGPPIAETTNIDPAHDFVPWRPGIVRRDHRQLDSAAHEAFCQAYEPDPRMVTFMAGKGSRNPANMHFEFFGLWRISAARLPAPSIQKQVRPPLEA
jgi:hypothetical protein